MTAADWEMVEAFHRQCSRESLLRRWGRTNLTPRDLTRQLAHAEYYLGLDTFAQPLALVSVGPVSREPGVVDMGLQVADARQGQGIGTALARTAMQIARAQGAHTLTALTQATNTPMLRLLDHLGPTRHTRDGPYVEVRVDLGPPGAAPFTQE